MKLMNLILLFSILITSQHSLAEEEPIGLTEAMLRAADEFPKVEAARLQRQATEEERLANLFGIASFTGTAVLDSTDGETTMGPVVVDSGQDVGVRSAGFQLALGFPTLFQDRLLSLKGDLQESAVKALRTQLASEAAAMYLNLYNSFTASRYFDQVLVLLDEITATELNEKNAARLEALKTAVTVQKSKQDLILENGAIDYEALLNSIPIFPNLGVDDNGDSPWKYDPIDFDQLDRLFTVPANAELAYDQALKSGNALVQANLGIKSARAQWFLKMSTNLPMIVVSAKKNWQSIDNAAGTTEVDSEVLTLAMNLNISGGSFNTHRAGRLLELAAIKEEEAVKRRVRAGIRKQYVSVDLTLKQLKAIDANMVTLFKSISKINEVNDANFDQFNGLLSNINQSLLQLFSLFTGFTTSRIAIHAQMGTLFKAIDDVRRDLKDPEVE